MFSVTFVLFASARVIGLLGWLGGLFDCVGVLVFEGKNSCKTLSVSCENVLRKDFNFPGFCFVGVLVLLFVGVCCGVPNVVSLV